MKKQTLIIIVCLLLVAATGYFFLNKQSSPTPQTQNLESRKTVENYFVENMRVSREEAKKMAADGVILRVSKDTTLMGIVGNLYSYGFIDNEDSFNKLLETTSDTTPGKEGVIKAGNNTIDTQTSYSLNYNMTDEQIADTLLNKGKFEENFTRYTYLFMPSGPSN
ncbi:MAG: hypothetical protein Q8P80_01160 [Candidatus Levybacteria bacterium]|nr:hypothetical protein [Candidatus Levybacteria bacterium]